MRNLKRALSLTLASVMPLGMMVIGSSAAKGYPDVDDNDNVEAIEVLQAVAVMVGDAETGNFRPDAPVSRAEMAVVMGLLLNLDYNYYVSTCPFADVSGSYEWARGWVGACAANGIIAGRSATSYDPGATVTAIEAASMMMRALGYFQNPEDYADGFQVVTVRQGSQIGIFNGIGSDATTPMTRNQVAQLALNALRSNMVDFTGNLGVEVNGVKVSYRAEYTPRTGTESKYNAIAGLTTTLGKDESRYYVQLGEQLYDGKLKLNDDYQDDFGRPARRWEYDGKEIGTYAKLELLREEYTTMVTGKMLYELLGKEIIADYDFDITIDGEVAEEILNSVTSTQKDQYFFTETALNRTNTNQVGGTGNGVLTQVFVDGDTKDVYIAIINTYLATAESDYNANKNEVSFKIWNVTRKSGALVKDDATVSNEKVSGEDFDIENVKSGDIVLVHVAENEIKEIFAPEVIDETSISAFKKGSYVVADGAQYDYASTAKYDDETLDAYTQDNMKNITYRVYLDAYGYLIGIEEVASEIRYVFLTGINSSTENLKDQTAIGNVIFLDGSSQNVTIDMKNSKNAEDKSFNSGTNTYDSHNSAVTGDPAYNIRYDTGVSSLMNTWCSYSVDDNNIYTLKEVANTADTVSATGVKAGQSHMGGTYVDHGSGDTFYYTTGTKTPATAATAQTVKNSSGTLTFGVANDGTDEEYVTINKGHVSLDGIVNSTAFKTVYGNDSTVYLTAETDVITAKNVLQGGSNKSAVIITGASTATVGVKNVDLKAYNAQAVVKSNTDYQKDGMYYENVSDGVYTLFNNKGYVIAAMVVGADDGSTTSFAWVSSSDMNREGLVNGNWEYTRDVLIDARPDTLTEVETNGSTQPDIGKAANFDPDTDESGSVWWEVTTKADGNVKEVQKITTNGSNYDYITDINDDDKDGTSILNQAFAGSEGYVVKGTNSTLQVESKTGMIRGFHVAEDANIAVVKDERLYSGTTPLDEWKYKENISYFTNDSEGKGLENAVEALTSKDNFKGWIAAVLKDGQAVAVILYDKADDNVDIGGTGGTEGIISTIFNGSDRVDILYSGNVPSNIAQLNAIIAALKAQNHVVRVDGAKMNSNGTFNATLILDDGSTITLTGVDIVLATRTMDAKGFSNMIDDIEADESATESGVPYVFVGTVTMDDGTITFASDSSGYGVAGNGTGVDGANALLSDIARVLGGLYNQMGIREIGFNGKDYVWDDNVGLKGSNWKEDGGSTSDTLVKAIATAATSAITANSNKVDGLEFTLTLDGTDWTIKIKVTNP